MGAQTTVPPNIQMGNMTDNKFKDINDNSCLEVYVIHMKVAQRATTTLTHSCMIMR